MPADSAASHAATDLNLRTGRRMAAILALALVLVAYALHAALPASPLTLPGPDAKVVRSFLPEGWAFFTKSPRSRTAFAYQLENDGTWRNVTAGALAVPSGLMGLDRRLRAQGTEIAMLLHDVPAEAWHECDESPFDCLNAAPVAGTAVNRSNHHTVCGPVGFVSQEVVPWAWRETEPVMPSKVLKVRVKC